MQAVQKKPIDCLQIPQIPIYSPPSENNIPLIVYERIFGIGTVNPLSSVCKDWNLYITINLEVKRLSDLIDKFTDENSAPFKCVIDYPSTIPSSLIESSTLIREKLCESAKTVDRLIEILIDSNKKPVLNRLRTIKSKVFDEIYNLDLEEGFRILPMISRFYQEKIKKIFFERAILTLQASLAEKYIDTLEEELKYDDFLIMLRIYVNMKSPEAYEAAFEYLNRLDPDSRYSLLLEMCHAAQEPSFLISFKEEIKKFDLHHYYEDVLVEKADKKIEILEKIVSIRETFHFHQDSSCEFTNDELVNLREILVKLKKHVYYFQSKDEVDALLQKCHDLQSNFETSRSRS